MTPSAFSGLMIVLFGALAGVLFFLRGIRARSVRSWRLICLGTAGICFYCSILWVGLLLSAWTITPELGRPALGLALAALAWFALVPANLDGRNDH